MLTKNYRQKETKSSSYRVLNLFRWTFTLVFLGFSIFIFIQMYFTDQEPQMKPYKFETPSTSENKSGTSPAPQPDKAEIIINFLNTQIATIAAYDEKDKQSIAFAINELEGYFNQKNSRIDAFLEDIFDFGSKAKMAYYYVRGNGRLEAYLQKMTEHYLGSPQDLENKLNIVTSSLKTDLKKNHNELMLSMETDLASVPYKLNISYDSSSLVKDFDTAFDNTLSGMLPKTVGVQLGVESAALAVDFWVAPMIARGIVSFIASRGIITAGTAAAEGTAVATGASLGPYTAGISIVIGTIIAVGIDFTCNKIAKADAKVKIVDSLKTWKEGAVAGYRNGAIQGVNDFQVVRQRAINQALKQEIYKVAYADQYTTSSQITAINNPSLVVSTNTEVLK